MSGPKWTRYLPDLLRVDLLEDGQGVQKTNTANDSP